MKNNYFLRMTKAAFLLFVFMTSMNAFAQVVITYPAPAQLITVCNDSSLLTVRIDATQASTTGGNITISLPSGVSYVADSVTKTSGTDALTINENGGTSTVPIFKLGPNNISVGDFIVFTIKRSATCAARTAALSGTIFKDRMSVLFNGATVTDVNPNTNSYLINYPSLSMIQPAVQTNAEVGVNYSRTFSITNGADGCANAVHFSITYPTSTIQNSLVLGGNTLTPTSVVGSTYNYTITGAALTADKQLCNGETLVFTENYKLKACPSGNTAYNVGWGCSNVPASWCQTATGSASVTMATGTPAFTKVEVTNLNFIDMCTPWDVRVRMYNSSTGTNNASAMYDAVVNFGMDYFNNSASGYNANPNVAGYIVNNIRIGTATAVTTVSGGAINTNMSQFTSDPDGPGVGLDDLDGDGFYDDLPAGAYIDMIYNYSYKCDPVCGQAGFAFHGPTVRLNYKNMCGQSFAPTPVRNTEATGSANYYGASALTPNSIYPVQVAGGDTFSITLAAGLGSYTLPGNATNNRYIWELTLPAGVTLISSIPAVTSQVGQVVRFTANNANFFNVNLNFVFNCGVTTNLVFTEKIIKINDITTGCQCRGELLCRDFTVQAICPSVCPTGGPTTYQPKVRRTDSSLGFTDYAYNVRKTATSLSESQLRRALYLQDIQITGKTIQNNDTDNLHLNFEIDKATNGDNKLLPVSATATVTRAGVVISTTPFPSSAFSTAASTATKTIVDLNLTSCFPSGLILAGDEINVVAVYKVSTNTLPTTPEIPTGLAWNFYNTSPTGPIACGSAWIPQMYLIGTAEARTLIATVFNTSGCGDLTLDLNERRIYNGTVNLFAGEIIPSRYIKTLTAKIPTGYEFVSATYGFLSAHGTIDITPTATVTPTTVTFTNDGTWTAPTIVNGNVYTEVRFQIKFKPTCAVLPTLFQDNVATAVVNDFYYANSVPTGQVPTDNSLQSSGNYSYVTYNYNNASKPAISLTNQTGTLQASQPTESFVVRMSSTSTTTAPYNWIAIPDVTNVQIAQVVDVATNAVMPSVAYPGGKLYYLNTTGLASGTFKDYRIDFTYTTCIQASFQVLGGWNCGEYPTDPNEYTCSKETVTLTFTPAISEVEIISVLQPTAPVNLCGLTDYQFDVNNVQAGNVIDSEFTLAFPIGNNLATGTFEAEYPKGAGNWQTVPFTQTGNTYVFDLSAHSNYPVQGVPGTLNTATTNNRIVSVRFKTTTTCEFISGSKFKVSTRTFCTC